ncbi:hypothetical protein [Photobacterium damselae]|uniref:hypothetical protein n=1 Tax=Photobacterium damselae TaxID=38293 RepID=UPI004067BF8B
MSQLSRDEFIKIQMDALRKAGRSEEVLIKTLSTSNTVGVIKQVELKLPYGDKIKRTTKKGNPLFKIERKKLSRKAKRALKEQLREEAFARMTGKIK